MNSRLILATILLLAVLLAAARLHGTGNYSARSGCHDICDTGNGNKYPADTLGNTGTDRNPA